MRAHTRYLPCCVFVVAFGLMPGHAVADVVTRWNGAALDAIRTHRTPPPIASRALAILHVSIFDAVNGLDRSYEPFFVRERPHGGASEEAAASAAAHAVLVELFPESAATFGELHAATLDGIRDVPGKRRGVEWGKRSHPVFSRGARTTTPTRWYRLRPERALACGDRRRRPLLRICCLSGASSCRSSCPREVIFARLVHRR
jgi:hypothetical protein